jgi:hypothetical protein
MITLYLLTAAWVIGLYVAWVSVTVVGESTGWPIIRWPHWMHSVLALLALTVAVRVVPALVLPAGTNFDIESYGIVASTLLHGQDVYQTGELIGRHPYLPLQMYAFAGAFFLSTHLHLPFALLVKLPTIAADAMIVLLMYDFSLKTRGPQVATIVGLLFAMNPVSVLVTAYHGQFDSVPLACALASWYWYALKNEENPVPSALIAGLFLGLGVLDKTWPVVIGPILLLRITGRRAKGTFCLGVAAPVLVGIMVYVAWHPSSTAHLLSTALGYGSLFGLWGYSGIVALIGLLSHRPSLGFLRLPWIDNFLNVDLYYGKFLTVFSIMVSYFVARDKDALRAIIITVLAVFAVTSSFSTNYLVWILPFAILADEPIQLRWYVTCSLVWMMPVYFGDYLTRTFTHGISAISLTILLIATGIPVWIACIRWMLQQVRGSRVGVALPLLPREMPPRVAEAAGLQQLTE